MSDDYEDENYDDGSEESGRSKDWDAGWSSDVDPDEAAEQAEIDELNYGTEDPCFDEDDDWT